MKAHLTIQENHPSYQAHRRQLWTQIILPVLAAALLVIGVAVMVGLATFRANGDVSRWAAISTIWIVIPIMIVMLVFLILLAVMIYLVAKLRKLIPPYSVQAQRFFYRIQAGTKRAAERIRKPVSLLQEIATQVRTYLARE